MSLEDITLHVNALGRDPAAVGTLVKNIVSGCGSPAECSIGTFHRGGYMEVDETPDGKRTRIVIGEEISSQFIIHIEGVPRILAEKIREELAGVFMILDDNYKFTPEDPPDFDDDGEDEECDDEHYLGDPDAWKHGDKER